MNKAIIKEVIVTSLLHRGEGTPESPHRIITQYWDKDGTLLAEVDPLPICEENRPIIRERNALRARVAELECCIGAQNHTNRVAQDLIQRLKSLNDKYHKAIKWALGEKGDFPIRREGDGPYHWRTKLRKLAGLHKK